MVEKKTVPKKKDPEKPATFKERLIQSAILGAVLGASTFWVIATAVNWTTRPAEYRAQLAEIKKIEKAIEANHRPLTHVPLFKMIYKLPHGEDEIISILHRLRKGRLDSVSIGSGSSNYEVAIEIDGVEEIRITMSELNGIGLSNASNVPLWVETADKNFRYHPKVPTGFDTDFKISAKATSGTPSIRWLITYREVP